MARLPVPAPFVASAGKLVQMVHYCAWDAREDAGRHVTNGPACGAAIDTMPVRRYPDGPIAGYSAASRGDDMVGQRYGTKTGDGRFGRGRPDAGILVHSSRSSGPLALSRARGPHIAVKPSYCTFPMSRRRMPQPARSRLRCSSKLAGRTGHFPQSGLVQVCATGRCYLLTASLLCAISAPHHDTALHASHLHRPYVSTYRRGDSASICRSVLRSRVAPCRVRLLSAPPSCFL